MLLNKLKKKALRLTHMQREGNDEKAKIPRDESGRM